jgi:hypothetical protein
MWSVKNDGVRRTVVLKYKKRIEIDAHLYSQCGSVVAKGDLANHYF